MMFEAGLHGEPRDAKRVTLIVSERLLLVANKQRSFAALQRLEQLNVKSFVISTRDLIAALYGTFVRSHRIQHDRRVVHVCQLHESK